MTVRADQEQQTAQPDRFHVADALGVIGDVDHLRPVLRDRCSWRPAVPASASRAGFILQRRPGRHQQICSVSRSGVLPAVMAASIALLGQRLGVGEILAEDNRPG